jgi:flagellar motor component MotA
MTWTITNLVIEIIAGIFGGLAMAGVAKEHSFGALGHAIAGALGGALSGYFLQTRVTAVVDSLGNVQQPSDHVTQWLVQAIAGMVAGAIVVMAVALAKHLLEHHRHPKA